MRTAAPRKILMTIDAVGGVWRYGMDLAKGLSEQGIEVVLAGFGPPPGDDRQREAAGIGQLVWLNAPLDWMATSEAELGAVPRLIGELADRHGVDLLHLNLPSQAAGLATDVPVVVVSHSCVVTWFAAVRGSDVPADWQFHRRLNAQGYAAADAVVVPSRAQGHMLDRAYGVMTKLSVVYNGSDLQPRAEPRQDVVFAAGRWWDEGKNGSVLNEAAKTVHWPVRMAGATRSPGGDGITLTHADALDELGHAATMDEISRAAIFVSPSIYEPFGLAALEAARLGAALVLSDIPTYRELWDGAALFADPGDAQGFARGINRLIAEPDLRSSLSRHARELSRHFTLERQVDAMSRIYGDAGLATPLSVPLAATAE
ncbi:glycosyltransferase family 4 protein [Rhizobium sp. SGZ-381]|uniref:glycosyltransferase family 4 protein n=1 Tax=Rhizobium sp. SGZ-381 TaxID=3342800 RepID=UPI00366B98A0